MLRPGQVYLLAPSLVTPLISDGEKLSPGHFNQVSKHTPKKIFRDCFSFCGVGTLVPVDGMMNSGKYMDVIQRKIITHMRVTFRDGGGIFQHDLAPCLESKKVKEFFMKQNVNVLEWPGNSPDLKPIENVWLIVKYHWQKLDCTTMIKLIEAIIQV